MKPGCIILTNRNSWVSEPVISRLINSDIIDLQSVVFFDIMANRALVRKRIRQYGLNRIIKKLFNILQSKLSIKKLIGHRSSKGFNYSLQTVKKAKQDYLITGNLNDDKTINYINKLAPDIVLVFSCSQILSPEFLSNKEIKYINFHDSILPRHKGPAPSFWVLYYKEETTGYTLHTISGEVDSGEIIYQEEVSVGNIKTEEALIMKIVNKAELMIEQVIVDVSMNRTIDFEKKSVQGSYESLPGADLRKELLKLNR